MGEDRWLTVGDIVQQARVHEQTVRRWLRSGELKGRNLRGKSGWRVRQSDLDRFLNPDLHPPRPPKATDKGEQKGGQGA